MMRYALILALAGASLAGMATPVGAHHSFSAFDRTTRVTWEGVITQVQWKSPHSWIFVDVTDASGVTVNWGFESVSAAMLAQRVKPSLLKKRRADQHHGCPRADPVGADRALRGVHARRGDLLRAVARTRRIVIPRCALSSPF